MSIQRLKYNVQDKMDLRPSEESSSSYTVQDESVYYKSSTVDVDRILHFQVWQSKWLYLWLCWLVHFLLDNIIKSWKFSSFVVRQRDPPPPLPPTSSTRQTLSRGTASILQQYLQNYQPQQASCRPFILPEKCRVIYARIYSFAVSNLPGLFLGI